MSTLYLFYYSGTCVCAAVDGERAAALKAVAARRALIACSAGEARLQHTAVLLLVPQQTLLRHKPLVTPRANQTTSSATADGPHDVLRQSKSCQLWKQVVQRIHSKSQQWS